MQHQGIKLSVLVAMSILMVVPTQGFAEDNSSGNSLPPGVQDNAGPANSQGNHYGWYKHQNQDAQTGSNPSQSDPNGQQWGDRQANRQQWLQNHPEAKEAMEQRRQQRETFMKNHPEMKERMEQRRQEREAFMKDHPEMKERMEQRRDERQQFRQNHPEAREARQQWRNHDRFQAGNGEHGNSDWGNRGQWRHHPNGNAYGNGQESGNGGQMGNSHSPH